MGVWDVIHAPTGLYRFHSHLPSWFIFQKPMTSWMLWPLTQVNFPSIS